LNIVWSRWMLFYSYGKGGFVALWFDVIATIVPSFG
jgi:hypothetical protein